MRNHGFGERVGVGTDIIKNLRGAAGWGSALAKPTYCYGISLRLPERCSVRRNGGGTEIDQVQQSVMLAQNFSVCGNLFQKNFCDAYFNR
jgi:hypothetical protein